MMNLHGVDIYLWSSTLPDLPKEHGPFSLKLISSRGTKVYPGPTPDMEMDDWPRCRFLSDAEVTDKQVDDLVTHLTGLGFVWTKTQKLYRKDGVDQFSQPY